MCSPSFARFSAEITRFPSNRASRLLGTIGNRISGLNRPRFLSERLHLSVLRRISPASSAGFLDYWNEHSSESYVRDLTEGDLNFKRAQSDPRYLLLPTMRAPSLSLLSFPAFVHWAYKTGEIWNHPLRQIAAGEEFIALVRALYLIFFSHMRQVKALCGQLSAHSWYFRIFYDCTQSSNICDNF